MILLALECSGNGCSAAVAADDRMLAHEFEPMARGQSERLIPMIQRVMAAAQLDFAALGSIAVTVGPGAFTGVRIGIAAARGLGLALALPVRGFTSFETVAAAAGTPQAPSQTLIVALDSRRDELYLQAFGADACPLGDGALIAPDAWAGWAPLGDLLLAGDGAPRLARALRAEAGSHRSRTGDIVVHPNSTGRNATDRNLIELPGLGIPDAAALAHLAIRRWSNGGPFRPVEPLYLRAPDVTIAAPARSARPL
jgi:tRNA threonylcarbamoyladenosine biosynthesis protein TsaB